MRRPIEVTLAAILFIVGLAACASDDTLTGLNPGGRNAQNIPGGGIITPPGGILRNPPPKPTPHYVAITAGNHFTCVLTNVHSVYCWGRSDSAQVGAVSGVSCNGVPCYSKPTIVLTGMAPNDTLRATAIDAGANHVCAIDLQSRAWCWGAAGSGQVGYPYGYGPMKPGLVPNTTGLTFNQISAGSTSTCAQANTGLLCWGELPLGTAHNLFWLSGDPSYASVTVGAEHLCAWKITAGSNSVDCGGLNNRGQTGVDSITHPSLDTFPAPSQFGGAVGAVSAGAYFTCAELHNGTIRCAGANGLGQLGNGVTSFYNSTPQTVGGGMSLHAVDAGWDHACALDSGANAWCWGNSDWGEVGNDLSNSTWGTFSSPQAVVGGLHFAALAAGAQHTCGISNESNGANHIYCWGINHYGQLGQGTTTSWFSSPIQVHDP